MAAQQYNPNLSNGTCYYVENTKTKGNFIPCGNDAIQAWPCCMAGSFCLSLGDANACWDAKSGNTYVAGCTDPSFTSPECLHKPPPFHDQEWVAINQACKNLNSNAQTTNVTNWTGCRWEDNSVDLVKLPLASCTPYCSQEHVLYAGSSSLQAYASLPVLSGSSIFWQNNYVPPATPAAGYTPGRPTGVVGTFTPTATAPISPETLTNTGLSTSAKIGIGVGAGVGGILFIAILVSLFVCCVRRRGQPTPAQLDNTQINPSSPNNFNQGYQSQYPSTGMAYAPIPSSSPKLYSTSPYSGGAGIGITNELDNTAHDLNSGPYTGYKTELPADNMHEQTSVSVPIVYQPPLGTGASLQPIAPGSSPPLSTVSTTLASSPSTGTASRYSHSHSRSHSHSLGYNASQRLPSPQFVEGVGDAQVPMGYGQLGGSGNTGVGQPGQPYYGYGEAREGGMTPRAELHGWQGGGRSP